MRGLFALIVFAACLGLVGCSTPYGVPIIEKPGSNYDATFPGIADIVNDNNTKVVWVHGMCTHDASWAIDGFHTLTAALGASSSSTMALDAPLLSPAKLEAPNPPQVIRFPTMVGKHSLEADFLLWSPLTAPYKKSLEFDNGSSGENGPFPYERASLNATLKAGLMNDCLVDAVVYAGPNGDIIRKWMRAEVCKELGGTETGSGLCSFSPVTDNTSVVLVSESLGSKMLFDAVRDIWARSIIADNKVQISRLANRLSRVQMIFMAANQIPILDTATQKQTTPFVGLSNKTTPYQSSFSDFLDALDQARASKVSNRHALSDNRLPPIHVVEFTDPNDLLSYRLTPDNIKVSGAILTNIIVSNDNTYLDLIERPDFAHCGYRWNNSVLGTIILGYQGGAVHSIPLDLKHQCFASGQ